MLRDGVFNRTLINRNTQTRNAFKAFQCSSNFQTHDEAINAGVSIAVPIFGVPIQFGGTFSESEKNTWKSNNCSEEDRSASFQEQVTILQQAASPDILQAWLNCTTRIGLQCFAITPDARTVIFRAIWNPSDGDNGGDPVVEGSSLSGGTVNSSSTLPFESGNALFRVGTKIRRGQGNSVLIRRNRVESVVMLLNTTRGDCNTSSAVPRPAPTPPPQPVYEMRWFKEDESGRPYAQTFSHVSQNRHNQAAVNTSGQYNLGDSSGRIYRVDFRCEGEFCGFNYNPDGGYSSNTTIIDGGRSFIWRRRWDGRPSTEFYTAYYEVQRRVCVRNCQTR